MSVGSWDKELSEKDRSLLINPEIPNDCSLVSLFFFSFVRSFICSSVHSVITELLSICSVPDAGDTFEQSGWGPCSNDTSLQ